MILKRIYFRFRFYCPFVWQDLDFFCVPGGFTNKAELNWIWVSVQELLLNRLLLDWAWVYATFHSTFKDNSIVVQNTDVLLKPQLWWVSEVIWGLMRILRGLFYPCLITMTTSGHNRVTGGQIFTSKLCPECLFPLILEKTCLHCTLIYSTYHNIT